MDYDFYAVTDDDIDRDDSVTNARRVIVSACAMLMDCDILTLAALFGGSSVRAARIIKRLDRMGLGEHKRRAGSMVAHDAARRSSLAGDGRVTGMCSAAGQATILKGFLEMQTSFGDKWNPFADITAFDSTEWKEATAKYQPLMGKVNALIAEYLGDEYADPATAGISMTDAVNVSEAIAAVIGVALAVRGVRRGKVSGHSVSPGALEPPQLRGAAAPRTLPPTR